MLKIHTVLCRAGTMDNYAYIIIDEATGISAVIDPSEPAPIIAECTKLGITPDYILNTHHHFDHTDGNLALKERYNAKVVANINDSARIPGFDIGIEPGKTFALGQSIAQIIDVSAHTQGHILYYFAKDKALFTGDTLFNLCVGGLFEGTVDEMYAALQKIKALPDNVNFYPGHEYTIHAAAAAFHAAPHNMDLRRYLQHADERLKQGLPVSPITLKEEKNCNPYLRAETLDQLKKLI